MRNRLRAGSEAGGLLGIMVFLAGVVLLLLTFKLAYDIFSVPPERAFGLKPGDKITVEGAGQSFAGIIIRALMLIVMGMIASLLANKGVSMFAGTRPKAERAKEESRE